MLGLPLAFTIPAILGALVLLPLLYFLLRVTPPRPRTIPFPPLRLIIDQQPREETPARTPPWLLLLRLAIAALVILAMAGPIWNPPASLQGGNGPVVILLDDGAIAAPAWDKRVIAAAERIKSAEREGRATAVVALSEGARPIQAGTAASSLDRLRALHPQPIIPDRTLALPALSTFLSGQPSAALIWVSDGVENGRAGAFWQALQALPGQHSLTIITGSETPVGIAGADNRVDSLDVRLVRADNGQPVSGLLHAFDLKGLIIGEAPFRFENAAEIHAAFALPIELRNDVARIAVAGVASSAAVSLLDSRWQRRRIGLVSGTTADTAQPLLSPAFYLARALAPFADVRQPHAGTLDPVTSLLDEQPSVMILADVNLGPGTDHDRLAAFVENGGLLIRFAGARLAGASDDLLPVNIRKGGRNFGGALSWDQPKRLAPFEKNSPFYGLQAHDEITVNRQVLAEPDPGIADRTWAQLTDGTPLVTADRRGKGTVVLFHVTADTTWSNLPLSGLFVDIMRRLVALSVSVSVSNIPNNGPAGAIETTSDAATVLQPGRILDGFGVLGPPPSTAKPLRSRDAVASLDNPPGFYGPSDGSIALNTLRPDDTFTRADLSGVATQPLDASEPVDLRAALIAIALVAFLADAWATLWLAGGLRRHAAIAAGLLLAVCLGNGLWSHKALAQDAPPQVSKQDMQSALSVRLAYVVSGDGSVDDLSRQGLSALSHALGERTSLTAGDPIGIDPTRDELAFYPLLYWPVVASRPKPSAATMARVAAYMKQGGTILFDTRDALSSRSGGPATPEATWLRDLLSGVDVPEIEPLPADHVVTRTFYILAGFVGRYATGQTWIEALPPVSGDEASRPARAGDSVSPIIITGNDLAGAWAQDSDGQPLFPLLPGGPRQRELALRGGINLVMYTLTGNYKADQVHVRDLLERLAR